MQNVITYDAVIEANNPDLKLFPGMTANVSILTDRREHALKIPNAALRFKPSEMQVSANAKTSDDNTRTVYVLDSGTKLRAVSVRTGISDNAYTEVLPGNLSAKATPLLSESERKRPTKRRRRMRRVPPPRRVECAVSEGTGLLHGTTD